jgi:hypothetical protein
MVQVRGGEALECAPRSKREREMHGVASKIRGFVLEVGERVWIYISSNGWMDITFFW